MSITWTHPAGGEQQVRFGTSSCLSALRQLTLPLRRGPPRDRRPPVDTLYCSYLRHWCSRVGSPNENKLVLLQLHVCSHQFTASQCLNWCYWWDSGRLVLLVLVLVLVLSWLDQLRRFPANKELGSVRAAPLNFTHCHFDPLIVLQSD